MRDIEWGDASYVRLYTYDHPSWMDLSWQAKGVYTQLRRKADRAGLLPMSKKGLRSLAGHMGHSGQADEILPFLQELVDEGWLEVHGDVAVIPQFIESESAHATNAQRSRKSREKRRDLARAQYTSTRDDTQTPSSDTRCNETLHHVTPSVSPSVLSPVSSRNVDQHVGEHVERNTTPPITITLSDHIHIPPNPPTGDSGGEGGRESKPVHDDPNLEDIRRKLLAMPPPLRHLPSVRAEERLYAPVMSGGLTVKHVLQAIDDAAVSLGPDLGDVQLGDRVGLTNLERFVAGCVKRARRERQAMPPAPTQPSQRHSAPVQEYQQPSPEALDALDRFREMYTSTGGYDRYVVGPDDTRLSAEAVAECAKHGDAQDILLRALDAYMRDDFYGSQGHTLKRFVAVLKSEPARLIGRRKHVETEEEKIARGKRKQLMEDLMHLVAP